MEILCFVCRRTDGEKGWCRAKIALMPVAVILFVIVVLLIGFILLTVLMAVRLNSLLSVSLPRLHRLLSILVTLIDNNEIF